MNRAIEEMYRTGIVRDDAGNEYDFRGSSIDAQEGNFLAHLISSDPTISRTLEVGCAFGISSLHICNALAGKPSASHLIIDPDESGPWHGVGIAQLRRAGFDFFTLVEEPSELALPRLLQKCPGSFDLMFIDGWHTFDHTMLDLFYGNRLIRIGGYLVIDDCTSSSVARAVSYFSKYPAYRRPVGLPQMPRAPSWKHTMARIGTTIVPPTVAAMIIPRHLYDRFYVRMLYPSMVVLQKVAEDGRSWDWFASF
jgi:predicted O-methyltransferase YrrM